MEKEKNGTCLKCEMMGPFKGRPHYPA